MADHQMLGMRLGGIDPSILRELSGVYKPFVKAFKELISNAFDADADEVIVAFNDDFASVTVKDDGNGMTPFEFRSDFTRIGGGSRRWAGDRTRKGRKRIGSKGIGFLALARYCDQLWVESTSFRDHVVEFCIDEGTKLVNIHELLGVPLSPKDLGSKITLEISTSGPRERKLRLSKDYVWSEQKCRVELLKHDEPVKIKVSVNCKNLRFAACLDFNSLLKMADNADLEKLDDFASIELIDADKKSPRGTLIRVAGLKPFVQRELRSERRKGFVRNVASQSGYEHFKWQLARCTPVKHSQFPQGQNPKLAECTKDDPKALLKSLIVCHGNDEQLIARPVFPFQQDAKHVPDDMIVPIAINEKGLEVSGFLAGYESVIFPAEFRGISIRVRGVAIGEAGFLGAEHLLTGANRAALSQITGELNVVSGLDAVDTLNPGRESFYEESEHFKILRRHMLGEGESISGHLGAAITAVLRRSQVRSSLSDVLGRASIRRRALEDVSAAVTHLVAKNDEGSAAIQKMLKSTRPHLNGLSTANEHELDLPPRMGGLTVVRSQRLSEPAEIDYATQEVRLDVSRPEWSWSLQLFNRKFQVLHKRGRMDQPIAEMDLKKGCVFINWNHPVKLQMDERGFIRTALAWILAKESACKDTEQMMDLAMKLLSFTASTNG